MVCIFECRKLTTDYCWFSDWNTCLHRLFKIKTLKTLINEQLLNKNKHQNNINVTSCWLSNFILRTTKTVHKGTIKSIKVNMWIVDTRTITLIPRGKVDSVAPMSFRSFNEIMYRIRTRIISGQLKGNVTVNRAYLPRNWNPISPAIVETIDKTSHNCH